MAALPPLAVLAVLAAVLLPAAAAEPCRLPPLVAERVGSAQIFAFNLDDRRAMIGRRDIVWGDNGERLPGLYSMKYMTVDRDVDAAHDVAWYEAQGRADWIARKCDGNPAIEFGDPNAPVDITRAEIREFLYAEAVAPHALSHRFDAMAVDNIASTNVFGRCGGVLARRYSGGRVDPAFAQEVGEWLQWLGQRIHRDGMCLAGNLWYDEDDIPGFRKLAALLDIVVDEGGFTRNCGASVTGAKWLLRLRTMRDVVKEKPLIVIDYVCSRAAEMTPQALAWSLANYLLLKGERTYLAIGPAETEQGPLYDPPQMHLETGRPAGEFQQRGGVFYREFERVLALVNPSSDTSVQFDLGPDRRWRDRDGSPRGGHVSLPPAGALVLVKP